MTSEVSFNVIQDSEERYLRPKALRENIDVSTWSETSRAWILDKTHGYTLAKVINAEDMLIEVELEDGRKVKVEKEQLLPVNAPRYDRWEDMTEMGELNEATVLHNLRRRYSTSLIHTYSGLFLVIVNPYRDFPIYTPTLVDWYRGGRGRTDRPPHVFAVANAAYRAMLSEKQNQSILITGESGAGKTENTKRVIQYLASVTNINSQEDSLEQQIILTNPILEAFGNAQTVRNNNSSRFGKFVRIDFDGAGTICGASIERYLLEKSRVTHRSAEERSFHVFYQLLACDDEELLTSLHLSRNMTCSLLEGKGTIEGVDDREEFKVLQNAMERVGIGREEQRSYFKVIAVILLMGNLRFNGETQVEIERTDLITFICDLLNVEEVSFIQGLLNPIIKAGKEIVSQARDAVQVKASVEALSRALYERMFTRLVERLNKSIHRKPNTKPSTFIGVLDIAGFEIFAENSFEQLCINYTNERLQQFFNHHMFITEQAEYAKEGIEWTFIDYGHDLQPTIDLIEKSNPVGILACLDEDCVLPKATDSSFTKKISALWKGKSEKFQASRFDSAERFSLVHYAGRVEYNTSGWLEKNKDPLNENLTRLLATSTDPFISSLFSDYDSDSRQRGASFRTVAQKHRESLNALMSQLEATRPHFVRCIIPNEEKQPGQIDPLLVLHQLRCNGVLEGIRVCKSGYPNKLKFVDFCRLYEVLAEKEIGTERLSNSSTPLPGSLAESKIRAKNLLEVLQVPTETFAIGRTCLFFRAGQLSKLDEARDHRLASILKTLQAACRNALLKFQADRESRRQEAIRCIQTSIRQLLTLRHWNWWKLYQHVRPLLNVTRAEKKIKELATEIEKISNERDTLYTGLKNELDKERDRNLEVESKLRELEREHQQLGLQLMEVKEDKEEIIEKNKQLELEIINLELTLKETEADRIIAEDIIKSKDQNITQHELIIEEHRNKIDALKREISESQLERDKLLVVEQSLNTRIVTIESITNQQKQTIKELESKLIQSGEMNKRLQEQMEMEAEQTLELQHQTRIEQDHTIKTMRTQLESHYAKQMDEQETQRRKLQRDLSQITYELEEERKQVIALKENIRKSETESSAATQLESAQANWKRERERLETRNKDLQRMQLESCEREEALHSQLTTSAEQARLLRSKIADVEDAMTLVEYQKRTLETRIETLLEQQREFVTLKMNTEGITSKLEASVGELESLKSRLEDEKLALNEKISLDENLLRLVQAELSDEKRRVNALAQEKNDLEVQVKELQVRLLGGSSDSNVLGGTHDMPTTHATIAAIKAQLESAAMDRASLLSDVRRLERSVRDLSSSLAEREMSQLALTDAASKAEHRARRLQARIDELEQSCLDNDRIKRRLERELVEEREKNERQLMELQRHRIARPSLQHQPSSMSVDSEALSTAH